MPWRSSSSWSVLIWIRLIPVVPHCSSGNSMRDPMPSTRSTSFHMRWARPRGTKSGSVSSSTPWPIRRVDTGACNTSANRRTAGAASCAPLPTQISGFTAARNFSAAASTASRSIVGIVRNAGPDSARRRLGPHVCGNLDGHWSWRAGDQFVERLLDLIRGIVGVANDRRVFGDLTQHRGLVVELVRARGIPGRGVASGSARRSLERGRLRRTRSTIQPRRSADPGPARRTSPSVDPVACAAPIAMYAQPCS